MSLNHTPRDYHNDDAVEEVDIAQIERTAYEKGRQAGELEAIRRIESEGGGSGLQKTFAQDTIIGGVGGGVGSLTDVVEINQLTSWQWISALTGEVFSIAYIVLMGIWIGNWRDGTVGWSNSDKNGDRGMFNVHVLTSFIGLWFVSQAYITYRILPINTSTTINKLWYVFCHLAASACFGISIAAAIMSTPSTRSWSMHAWTAYAAVLLYFLHAVYSSFRVMFFPWGTSITNWNETHSGVTTAAGVSGRHMSNSVYNTGNAPATTSSTTAAHGLGSAEQRRDGEMLGRNVLYTPGPSVGIWRSNREATLDVDARNANLGTTQPRWSEAPMFERNHYFLVPRAKWAVMALMGLMASVLMGIAEWQVLLGSGILNWPQEARGNVGSTNQSDFNGIGFRSDESIVIGILGLVTLLGTLAIGYAAVPPRTTLSKSAVNGSPYAINRRTSVSTGTTAPPTRNQDYVQPQAIEVV